MNKLEFTFRRRMNQLRNKGLAASVTSRRDFVAPSSETAFDVAPPFDQFDTGALRVVASAPVSMTQAERLTLFALVYALRPRRYLEIGTFRGGSALIVAAAMNAQHSDGRIFCVDPAPQIAPADWAALQPRATLVRDFSPAAIGRARELSQADFDFALIDGDHTRAGVFADAAGVLPFMIDGGLILFHDAFNDPVNRAIGDALALHPTQLADCGFISRERTQERLADGSVIFWAGLRLLRKTCPR